MATSLRLTPCSVASVHVRSRFLLVRLFACGSLVRRWTTRRAVHSRDHFRAPLLSLVGSLDLMLHARLGGYQSLVLAFSALFVSLPALFRLVRRVARERLREVVQLMLVARELALDLPLFELKVVLRERLRLLHGLQHWICFWCLWRRL